jgi:hypothetical protein
MKGKKDPYGSSTLSEPVTMQPSGTSGRYAR